jgi:cytochrome c-type biogenesis protein CcmF
MLVLGLAIMLGGYWAYGVLGWGGWWGWDPVENSSLVPWIIGIALIHTLLVQQRTQSKGEVGRFGKTNLILAILTFLLVLYSTFLTRSGILGDASVHSFAEPGFLVYWLLIAFIAVFALLGFGAIVYRWKYLEKHFNYEENILSRELALFTGSVALIASAIIIIVGTSSPIFGKSVDISFYNELNLPIAIIIALLNGFSLLLKWKHTKGESILKQSIFSISATVVSTLLMVFIGKVTDLMLIIFTFATFFALFVNLEIAFKIIKGKKTFLGAYVTHAGLAIFFLGIIASGGYTQDKQVKLYKGEKEIIFGYDVTFTGYTPFDENKYAFNVEVVKDNDIAVISPVMYISSFNNQLMREPDILTRLTKDFYISPLGYDEGEKSNHSHGEVLSFQKGETKTYKNLQITFTKFNVPHMGGMDSGQSQSSITVGAILSIDDGSTIYEVEPRVISSGNKRTFTSADVTELNLKFTMTNLNAAGSIELDIAPLNAPEEKPNNEKPTEALTIEASIKPFISLIWLGVIFIVAGMAIATLRRLRESLN